MTRAARAVSLVAAAAFAGAAPASADPPGTAASDDAAGAASLTPYELDARLGHAGDRARRHEALAGAALAAGDAADHARHMALACAWGIMVAMDPAGDVPSCEAARVATARGPLDAQLMLAQIAADLAAWRLDVDDAERRLRDILARGAAIEPTSPGGFVVARAWVVLGALLGEAGRFDESLATLDQAEAVAATAGATTLVPFVHYARCRTFELLVDRPRARAACAAARAAVAPGGDWYLELNLTFLEGLIASDEGRLDDALASYRRTLELARQPGGAIRWVHAGVVIASAEIDLGRFADARRTLAGLEREAPAPMRAQFAYLIAHQWGKLLRAEGDLAGAARRFEQSRRAPESDVAIWGARGLAGVLRRQGDLVGAEAALAEAIRELEARRITIGGAARRATFVANQAALYQLLAAVILEREGAAGAGRALVAAEAGRARALRDALAAAQAVNVAAPVLDAAALQATLATDEALIEYVATDDRLLAITATRTSIAMTELPAAGDAAALATRAEFFRQLVEEAPDRATIAAAGAALHDDVLGPASAGLPASITTLVIVPDGPLRDLPFDALHAGATPLLDRWRLAIVPAVSALAARAPRPAPTASALVIAAPAEPTLGPLPGVPAEAAAVQRALGGEVTVLGGAAATVSALTAASPERFAVLHVASHAVLDGAVPLRSALVLAPDPGAPSGRWSAEAIYRLSLAADLVVLSACATAAGPGERGEGTMSLARAFLHAGAAATVATLWDLDDAAGPAFASRLYRGLARGEPLGAAVAGAKRSLAAAGAPPRVWAAFVLTGAPGASVRVREPPSPRPARWPMIAGGLALIGLGLAARRRARRVFVGGVAVAALAQVAVLVAARGPGAPAPRWSEVAPSRRSAEAGPAPVLGARFEAGSLTWRAVPGVVYRVVPFSADGRPLQAIAPAAPPVPLPDLAAWATVEAVGAGGRPALVAASSPADPGRSALEATRPSGKARARD